MSDDTKKLIDYFSSPGADADALKASLIGLGLASDEQGAKADTALQPDDIGLLVATASQGTKADTAVQPNDLNAAVSDLEGQISASSKGYIEGTSWTDLSTNPAKAGTLDGQLGRIPNAVTGTHTGYYLNSSGAPVSGTANDAGEYQWSLSLSAWIRTGNVIDPTIIQSIYKNQVSSGLVSALTTPGLYLIAAALTDIPTYAPTTAGVIVEAQNSDWVKQTYYDLQDPSKAWARSIRISTSAIGSWSPVAGSGAYLANPTSGDLNSFIISGRYLISGTLTNAPTGAPTTAFLDVRVFGTWIEQIYTSLSQPSLKWARSIRPSASTYNAWYDVGSGGVYRGAISTGSFNSLTAGGLYIISAALSDAPTGVGSCLLEVDFYNSNFVIQTITIIPDPTIKWIRIIKPATSVYPSWAQSGGQRSTPWAGKVAVCIGDSLTGNGDYPARFATRTGMTVTNGGMGGTTMQGRDVTDLGPLGGTRVALAIATGDWTALVAAAQTLYDDTGTDHRPKVAALKSLDWTTVDYVVIGYGTNDWNVIKTIGASSDTAGETSYAASIKYIIEHLLGAYPKLKLMFWGPIFRKVNGLADPVNSDTTPNTNGEYLHAYGKMVVEVCQLYKIPAVDLYPVCGINELNAATMTADGTHPVAGFGWQHLADKVGSSFSTQY
ncbi:SGNH/GDSL hydrolase family protein [Rhizobium sp. A37_96]